LSESINAEEYIKTQKDILNQLSSLENKSFETKKSYIVRLKEVTRPLLESGYYDGLKLNDLCSFIYDDLLKKHGVTVSRNDAFYALFDETEKHSEKNPLSTKKRLKISSLPLDKQTGNTVIDKLKQYARAEVREPHEYGVSNYLKLILDVSNQTTKQAESLLSKLGKAYFYVEQFEKQFSDMKILEIEIADSTGKKKKDLESCFTHYQHCKQSIVDIESGIGKTENKITDLKETLSEQRHISKQLDERNKITFLEKWNAIVANISLGVSAVAKKLGVNKKHLTNNVRPAQNPVTQVENMHHKYIDWFKAIKIVTPNGEEFIFDAKDYFDEQIERGKLQLPFKPLVLSNSKIE
jgi:DNA-binding phage protein